MNVPVAFVIDGVTAAPAPRPEITNENDDTDVAAMYAGAVVATMLVPAATTEEIEVEVVLAIVVNVFVFTAAP